MARDRRRHGSKNEVQDAPSSAMPSGHNEIGQEREQFLALICALARQAARVGHETDLARIPEPRQSFK